MSVSMTSRRNFLKSSAALLVLGGQARALRAQITPERATIICGYPPGGSADLICRRLGERLTGSYARSVVVENKPGAAGRIAVESLKKAPADGSVLVVTPASVLTMYPHVYPQLAYDVFNDLAPVSTVALTSFALAVGPKVPASVQNFASFVQWCKANPGQADCGNAGAGSMPHFMALLLAREAGIPLTHVPYKGGLAAMQDVAAGQVAAALATESSALALSHAGKLRVLATTANGRSAFFADAPTFGKLGFPALTRQEWFGVFAPARTPAAAIEVANAAIRQALLHQTVSETWNKIGLVPDSSTHASLGASLRTEHDFWGPLIRSSGFKPEA